MPPNEDWDYYLIACGMVDEFIAPKANTQSWKSLDAWFNGRSKWCFGYVTYDAKNGIEVLGSRNPVEINFPDIHFFEPQSVISYRDGKFELIQGEAIDLDWLFTNDFEKLDKGISPHAHQSQAEYVNAVKSLQEKIQLGDIYEINYCQQFSAQVKLENPLGVFRKLYALTEAPHALFLRVKDKFVLCGSPERYLSRNGEELISQPIKGTIRRSQIEEEDEALKISLKTSEKEISENVMIVDLVRNDLSKSAHQGSVEVVELCGLKTFKTVHHLVSTIRAKVDIQKGIGSLLMESFPMGSMTGAPKVRAMELIDEFEISSRGIYSGTIGFVAPNGNFDMNVVIRSLIYDECHEKLVFHVGGAITAKSDPEKEYEECLLKAEALLKALTGDS